MNWFSVVDHSLEELRRIVIVEVDILGGHSPEVVGPVGDNPGRSLEDIGCMGLT